MRYKLTCPTKKLGLPYSVCQAGPEIAETGNVCLQNKLNQLVSTACHCIPDFIEEVDAKTASEIQQENFTQFPSCNFFQHAFCAAKLIRHFHWSATEQCEPLCTRNVRQLE